MTQTIRRLSRLALPLVLAATGSAVAEELTAYSRTAMAITGDITMDDFGVTFEDGTHLVFDALVDDSLVVGGQRVPASVYLTETAGDPELLNGNRLCGEGDVTFVASWNAGDDVVLAVFTTQDVPGSDADMCASYTYSY